MLKANSRKAKENLKAYILAHVTGWEKDPETAQEAAEQFFCVLVWNHGGVSDAFYKLGKF